MIPLLNLFIYQFCQKYLLSKNKLSKNIISCISILIILLTFQPDISYRIKEGVKKMNQRYEYIQDPSVLKGLKLTPEDARFYNYSATKFSEYWNIYNKNIESKVPLLISFWDQVPPGYCRIDNISNYDSASLSQPCQ
jgi:hypothetical protein